MECGFVSWHGGGRVSAVDSVDLELAYHGEGGRMPKNYGFNFTAGPTKINWIFGTEHHKEGQILFLTSQTK